MRGLRCRDPLQEIRATIFPEAENLLELCFNLNAATKARSISLYRLLKSHTADGY